MTDETTQDDQVFEMLLDKGEQNCDRASVKSVLGDGVLFSSIKWIFGESVRASSREGMFREAQMKFRGYNILLAMVQ